MAEDRSQARHFNYSNIIQSSKNILCEVSEFLFAVVLYKKHTLYSSWRQAQLVRWPPSVNRKLEMNRTRGRALLGGG